MCKCGHVWAARQQPFLQGFIAQKQTIPVAAVEPAPQDCILSGSVFKFLPVRSRMRTGEQRFQCSMVCRCIAAGAEKMEFSGLAQNKLLLEAKDKMEALKVDHQSSR